MKDATSSEYGYVTDKGLKCQHLLGLSLLLIDDCNSEANFGIKCDPHI